MITFGPSILQGKALLDVVSDLGDREEIKKFLSEPEIVKKINSISADLSGLLDMLNIKLREKDTNSGLATATRMTVIMGEKMVSYLKQ